MSASEKLRALDEQATPAPWYEGRTWRYDDPYFPEITPDDIFVLATLRNALPLIADVVEAAEREHPEPHNYWAVDKDGDETTECPACAALAALRKHLERSVP